MPNISTFRNALLAAFGDSSGALNVNDFYTKMPLAIAAPAFARQPLLASTATAQNVTATTTAAALLGGIITSTTAAAVSLTLPLGSALETALDAAYGTLAVNQSFLFTVVATGANAVTLLTAAGWTLVGSMVVATATSGTFQVVRTAAGTFTLYRV
jgi:hypothetical protein